MNPKIIRRITAHIAAQLPDGRKVVIEEMTHFVQESFLEGGCALAESKKEYRIYPNDPVNRDGHSFTLARTGEPLILS